MHVKERAEPFFFFGPLQIILNLYHLFISMICIWVYWMLYSGSNRACIFNSWIVLCGWPDMLYRVFLYTPERTHDMIISCSGFICPTCDTRNNSASYICIHKQSLAEISRWNAAHRWQYIAISEYTYVYWVVYKSEYIIYSTLVASAGFARENGAPCRSDSN